MIVLGYKELHRQLACARRKIEGLRDRGIERQRDRKIERKRSRAIEKLGCRSSSEVMVNMCIGLILMHNYYGDFK